MTLALDVVKIVLADIYFYNVSTGSEDYLKVSSLPYAGYLPFLIKIDPFNTSLLEATVSHGFGGVSIGNPSGMFDYLVYDSTNNYVFNKRKAVLRVVENDVVVYSKEYTIEDATLSESELRVTFTDKMQELEQPLITIDPQKTGVNIRSAEDQLKPYNVHQLYNDLRNTNTGVPINNPRYQDGDTMLPVALGDVYNFTPYSLDFIYTDNADSILLLCPPSLYPTLDVVVHNVKDSGVLLIQGEDWELVEGKPYLLRLLSPAFGKLTVDLTVGPSTIKELLITIINNFPQFGSQARSIPIETELEELNSCNYHVGGVWDTSSSIQSIVKKLCDSAFCVIYCNNNDYYTVIRKKHAPVDNWVVDPLYGSTSFYSAGRLANLSGEYVETAGSIIPRDDNGYEGFNSSGASISKRSEGQKVIYNLPDTGWTLLNMTSGKALKYYSSSDFFGDHSIELFFMVDYGSDKLYSQFGFTPILEIPTVSVDKITNCYASSIFDGEQVNPLDLSDAEGVTDTITQHGISIWVKNGKLCVRNSKTSYIESSSSVLANELNYLCVQYTKATNSYCIYLNSSKVFSDLTMSLDLGFRQLIIGGAYDIGLTEIATNPTRWLLLTDATQTDSTWLTSLDYRGVFKVNKPFEMTGDISDIRITRALRYPSMPNTIEVPGPTLYANINKGPVGVITYKDIIKNSFNLAKVGIPSRASVTLDYARNWTPNIDPAGIFEEFPSWKTNLAKVTYQVTVSDKKLLEVYKYKPVNTQESSDTLLVSQGEALQEATYRLNFISRKSMTFVMLVGKEVGSTVQLGDYVVLKHHRFNIDLHTGRLGIVIGKTINILDNTYSIGVLV